MSYVICDMSDVRLNKSNLKFGMSPVTCHVSPVMCHLSLTPTARPTDPPSGNSPNIQSIEFIIARVTTQALQRIFGINIKQMFSKYKSQTKNLKICKEGVKL